MSRITRRTIATLVVAAGLVGSSVTAAHAVAEPGDWVVLGDSYTAGYFAGDVVSDDGCLRTSEAYPVVAHAAARPDLRLVDVSCVGAETKHMWESQTPPAGDAPVAPQLDALSDRAEVVTVGIGGNSMGFGTIMATCLFAGIGDKPDAPCAGRYGADLSTGSLGEQLESGLEDVLVEYGRMLDDVRAAAPNARIVTVGYPQITPSDPSTCTYGEKTQFSTMARSDIPFFQLIEREPNVGIAAQSLLHDVAYVDTDGAGTGRDVCADPAVRWIEGMYAADGSGTYIHPNSRGHAAEGALVAAAVTAD